MISFKACNVMNGGCAQSPCAFGCKSNDNSGYTCGCPRGYRYLLTVKYHLMLFNIK